MRALLLGALLALTTLPACAPDHDADRPGPPRVVHAYMVEAAYLADGTASYLGLLTDPAFDPTNPDVWRTLPDLSGAGGSGPYAPPSLIRAVLSELPDGDLLEDIDPVTNRATLKSGIITVSARPLDPLVVPTAEAANPPQGSYFDPSGAETTGPPGPALVMAPRPTLPASSVITVTLSGAAIRDTRGNPMAGDAVFSFETRDMAPLTVGGELLTPEGVTVPPDAALEIAWNTLLAAATVLPSAFELRGPPAGADGLGTLVPVDLSFPDDVTEALGGVPAVTLTPRAPLEVGASYRIVIKTTLTDVFAMPLRAEVTIPVAVAAPEM
jgi:hypothetical protein